MKRGIPLLIGAFFYFNAEGAEINSNGGITERLGTAVKPPRRKSIFNSPTDYNLKTKLHTFRIAPFSTPLPSPQSCGEASLRTSVNLPCKVCNVWERFYSVIGTSAQAEPLTKRHQAEVRLNQNPIFCIIEGRKTLGEFSSPQLQAPVGVQNMDFAPIVHPRDRRRSSGLISLFRFFSPRYHQVST